VKILQTSKYQKDVVKLVAGNKQLLSKLLEVYKMLEEDIFNPRLRTHKLKGEFEGKWACSLTYNIRIVFKFTTVNNEKIIELLTVGSHDVVY
jgi:addiction module RelE/StbE family toxin